MKISELFSLKEASTFPAEFPDPPQPQDCNCKDIFLGGQDIRDPLEFNKAALSGILSTMFGGGDKSVLTKMRRANPAAQDEWQRHFISHMNAAGVTPSDLGFEDHEIGKRYRRGESVSNLAGHSVAEPYDYSSDNCGTCNSYLDTLKGMVRKHFEDTKRKIEDLPEAQKPYARDSVGRLFSGVWESWVSRKPASGVNEKLVERGNRILDKWNEHTIKDHEATLRTNPFKYTPVAEDSTGELFNNVYDSVKGLPSGWSEGVRDDSLELSDKRNEQLNEMFPYSDTNNPAALLKPKEVGQRDAFDLGKNMVSKGEISWQTIPRGKGRAPLGIIDTERYTGYGYPGENSDYMIERKPTNVVRSYDPKQDVRSLLFDEPVHTGPRPEIMQAYENHTGTQCFNGDCKNPEKCNGDHEVTYVSGGDATTGYKTKTKTVNYKRTGCTKCGDPSCDGWHAKDQTDLGAIPRQHAFLFQKAGMMPDLAAHKEILRKLHEHEMSKGVVPTGRTITRTVEEPDVDMVPHAIIEQWKELPDGQMSQGSNKYEPFDETIHSGLRTTLLPVQKRDAAGNGLTRTRTIEEPEYAPAEPKPAPTPEEHAKARADYQASFDKALETAYPGMGREEALDSLGEEHQQRVTNLEIIRNKSEMNINRKIQASKDEKQRPVFNAARS